MQKPTLQRIAVLSLLALVVSTLVLPTSSTLDPRERERYDRLAQQAREEAREFECLARNIYFEARSETVQGKRAVAHVTLNRVEDPRFPKTICAVVHQARVDSQGRPLRNQCQFSWFCDGKPDVITDHNKWHQVQTVARSVLSQHKRRSQDPTGGATMYHADYVEPHWRDSFRRTVRIDTHIFYK